MKDYWEKVEYIHLNPVRRGLVARPEDWTWSSAAEYSGASPEEQRRRCGLVITGYDYQRRARPASDLRRLDARANPTSRRPKGGVCATPGFASRGHGELGTTLRAGGSAGYKDSGEFLLTSDETTT